MILNVDRSTPEHEFHSTGSVWGGGQRGTGRGGPTGSYGRVADRYPLDPLEGDTGGKGVKKRAARERQRRSARLQLFSLATLFNPSKLPYPIIF